MRGFRYLDKLVDELAKGRATGKVLREGELGQFGGRDGVQFRRDQKRRLDFGSWALGRVARRELVTARKLETVAASVRSFAGQNLRPMLTDSNRKEQGWIRPAVDTDFNRIIGLLTATRIG